MPNKSAELWERYQVSLKDYLAFPSQANAFPVLASYRSFCREFCPDAADENVEVLKRLLRGSGTMP